MVGVDQDLCSIEPLSWGPCHHRLDLLCVGAFGPLAVARSSGITCYNQRWRIRFRWTSMISGARIWLWVVWISRIMEPNEPRSTLPQGELYNHDVSIYITRARRPHMRGFDPVITSGPPQFPSLPCVPPSWSWSQYGLTCRSIRTATRGPRVNVSDGERHFAINALKNHRLDP